MSLTRKQVNNRLISEQLLAFEPLNTTDADPRVITYQFADSTQPIDLWNTYTGWTALSNAEENAVRAALAQFEDVMNVTFVETQNAIDPDLNLGKASLSGNTAGLGGWQFFYNGFGQITEFDGFAVFDNSIDLTEDPALILHEIGHAFGLKHPFETPALPDDVENSKYTVMSYSTNPDTGEDPDTLQIYDITALQALWGEAAHNNGNTVYTGRQTDYTDAIWDSGGVDTFDASADPNGVSLDMRVGQYSQWGNRDDVSIAFGTVIENAIGSDFADDITANNNANEIRGGRGADEIRGYRAADVLMGEAGNDWLVGGKGNDELIGDTGADILDGGESKDTLIGGKGTDTFVYKEGYGRDRIEDFVDDVDEINLRSWDLTRFEAMGFASQSGDDVVFDFGGDDILRVVDATVGEVRDDILV